MVGDVVAAPMWVGETLLGVEIAPSCILEWEAGKQTRPVVKLASVGGSFGPPGSKCLKDRKSNQKQQLRPI